MLEKFLMMVIIYLKKFQWRHTENVSNDGDDIFEKVSDDAKDILEEAYKDKFGYYNILILMN